MATSMTATTNIPQPKKVAFRFCRECSNMLYPREDKLNSVLLYMCRSCGFAEPAVSSCIYRNELSNTVGETAGITQDVGSDPTVGDETFLEHNTPVEASPFEEGFYICTMCGQEILCESCGQGSGDVGLCLEVDEHEHEPGCGSEHMHTAIDENENAR